MAAKPPAPSLPSAAAPTHVRSRPRRRRRSDHASAAAPRASTCPPAHRRAAPAHGKARTCRRSNIETAGRACGRCRCSTSLQRKLWSYSTVDALRPLDREIESPDGNITVDNPTGVLDSGARAPTLKPPRPAIGVTAGAPSGASLAVGGPAARSYRRSETGEVRHCG
jgi:hypothetical protein